MANSKGGFPVMLQSIAALGRSLQFKLSALVIVLLFSVSGVYLVSVMNASERYVAEAVQRLNRPLADSIAKVMQIDTLTGEVDAGRMKQVFDGAMVINPSIELYLVSLEGRVVAHAAPPDKMRRTAIALEPVTRFLGKTSALPVFGDDPRSLDAQKIFSAALLPNRDGSPYGYLYIILSGEDYTRAVAATREGFVFAVLVRTLIVSLFAAVIIGLFVIYFLTGDLRELTLFVRSIQGGDFSRRLAVSSKGDLAELAAAFNDMSGKVETSIAKLTSTDALRRELIANVSHDLRTPLASIEGYLETILMKENFLNESEREHYLQIILKNTRSLSRLVAALFELSKLEANQITVHAEAFSITELVQDILSGFRVQADGHGAVLTSRFDTDLPFVYGDISLIERVIRNLVDNAIRYGGHSGSGEGCNVLVLVSRPDDRHLRISVSDSGSGISEAELPYLFDRFYRSDTVRVKGRGGSGLGLTIAKKITELHGSDLTVRSREHQGTAFSFDLPVHIEAAL
ncbi:MAG: HAMP domain-containing histidine kinase [Rhizobacter sp.]|nr:HAMP domain-containing histidine kinase [Chlorobiales bacterium]